MTPEEVKAIREELGLTQRELGLVSRSHKRTIRRWERPRQPNEDPFSPVTNTPGETVLEIIREFPQLARLLLQRAQAGIEAET
jgi:DNA-binding transcriptional regulator YiaG